MASYFVLDNKFTPYTFEELIKPYQLYNEAYEKQEAALSDLNTTASTIESLISQENDPIAYARYSNYINSVRDVANQLYSKGLMPSTRSNVYRLRGNYSQDIVPIITAASRRKELQDEQRKALMTNPTIRYQRNFNTISDASSIDRFLENPNYDYGSSFTGSLLTKQVSDQVSSMAKELSQIGTKPLDKYTNMFIQRHGFTRQQVMDAINNPTNPNSSKVLTALVENVVDASGVKEWGNESDIKEAYRYANMGLYSGIGETKISTYDNYGARLAAQIAASRAKEEKKTKGHTFDRRNTFTQKEVAELNDDVNKFGKYFKKAKGSDGKEHYVLTNEGYALARIRTEAITSGDGVRYVTKYGNKGAGIEAEKFVKFLQSNGLGDLVVDEDNKSKVESRNKDRLGNSSIMAKAGRGTGIGDAINDKLDSVLSNLESTYNSALGNTYDATKHTEYTKSVAKDYYDNVVSVIASRSNNGKVTTVDWDKDSSGNYVLKNSGSIDLDKISASNIQSMQSVSSVGGNFVEIKTTDNKTYKIPLGSIHNRADTYSSAAMNSVSDLVYMKNHGVETIEGVPIDEYIEDLIEDSLNNGINAFIETKVKAEEV